MRQPSALELFSDPGMTYPLSDSFGMKFNISKPTLPYLWGQQYTIHSHNPPPPTAKRCALSPSSIYERETKHPLDRCLLHQPLPGSSGRHTVIIRIAEAVRTGDKEPAQLVKVQIQEAKPGTPHGPPTDSILVAKFYDPLYYDHDQDDADPFLCVDRDYSHETAAYSALTKLQGKLIPKYYGSYSLELIVNKIAKRFVRLILIELIPGKSMQQLNPADFSQIERQMIIKLVIDTESLIYTHNVLHGDVFPRNILLPNSDKLSRSERIVLVDFALSSIGRSHFPNIPAEENRFLPGIPISPLLRWNEAYEPQTRFGAWVDWDWQPWLEQHYRWTEASITDEMRSTWLPSFLTSTPPEPLGFS